jgi:type III secretion system YopN/LcrE/InvE/MxiC family regulator
MAFDGAQFLRNPIRFDRMDTMTPGILDAPAAKAPETGRLGGATVVVQTDATADLMDSMEELSMQFEEKSAKKLSDRKLGDARMRSSAYVDAVEKWMKTMPDMPGKKDVENLLRQLRQMAADGRDADASALKGMLAKLSGDPSHQFALLDILDSALEAGEEGLGQLVGKVRSELVKEKGGEIRAGINLASEVNARSTTPEEMSDLRNLYRSEILGFKSPQDCFRSLLASRGAGGLDGAIEFLFKGCGVDLTSAMPSRDAVELRRIMQDLQCVQVLKTVLGMMDQLGARMAKEFGVNTLLGSEAMTSRIADFTENPFVTGSQIGAFVSECAVMKLLAQMDFTRELMNVFRKLSPRLFAAEEDRQKLVDSTQEHLDSLIAEEIDADEGKEDTP